MRRIAAVLITASLLAGCAHTAEVTTASQAAQTPPVASKDTRRLPPSELAMCNPAPAQYHLGQTATQAVGEAILKETGARILRWGPPNSAWSMDYRIERVSVSYDANMTITRIACG